MKRLLKASSLGVLGIVVAGCSSGFQRFDRSIYEEAVPQQTSNVQNPYPGTIDPTTTASTGGRFEPLKPVAPQAVLQGVYHNPEPTFAQSRQPLASYTSPAPSYQASATSSQWKGSSQISSSSLPKLESKPQSKPVTYTPPKPESDTVYIAPAKTDTTTTASVQPVSAREAGWTSTGGTTITIREGETLYNLSKRYGVPVNEIRKVNGLSAADGLKAGHRVIIPNYIFSRDAAISAPDNDPKTRAASAGIGYVGEAKNVDVRVPTKRPYTEVAAISPEGNADNVSKQRYVPKTHTIAPTENEKTPDYGIVTGSVDTGSHTVRSGDSLSKIAASYGTTVSEIKRVNGLSGNNIRIGQKLTLPGAVDNTTTASVKDLPSGVDPIVTGSLKTPETTSKGEPEVVAPARTGISEFRWPVKGRVISEFGAPSSNGKNEGVDISVPEGTAVRAAENGVVIYTGNEISAYGNLVLVRHEDDWVSAYAHNREFEVKKGDSVRRGQIIARSGKTGNADRPKLHFELRKESKPVDPKQYLAGA
ncbi:MAG: peptidoglycan DD-metalloendopeptidase family protein [Pseudomonadota bacterium]